MWQQKSDLDPTKKFFPLYYQYFYWKVALIVHHWLPAVRSLHLLAWNSSTALFLSTFISHRNIIKQSWFSCCCECDHLQPNVSRNVGSRRSIISIISQRRTELNYQHGCVQTRAQLITLGWGPCCLCPCSARSQLTTRRFIAGALQLPTTLKLSSSSSQFLTLRFRGVEMMQTLVDSCVFLVSLQCCVPFQLIFCKRKKEQPIIHRCPRDPHTFHCQCFIFICGSSLIHCHICALDTPLLCCLLLPGCGSR